MNAGSLGLAVRRPPRARQARWTRVESARLRPRRGGHRERRRERSGERGVVREHLDVAVAEAKHAVEGAPCVLARDMEGRRANAFRDALVGARAGARTT
jgi:hypothetical protein